MNNINIHFLVSREIFPINDINNNPKDLIECNKDENLFLH